MRILEDFYTSGLTEKELIKMMLTDGITALEIVSYFDKTSTELYKIRKETPDIVQNFKAFKYTAEHINCHICNKIVNIKNVPIRWYNDKKLYLLSYCLECKNVGDLQPALKNSLAKKLTRKENSTRNDNQLSVQEIPLGYYAFLYNKQDGKCFYSGEPLIFQERAHLKDTLSVDRVVFDKGYKQGNIVFASNKLNIMKSDMTVTEMKKWSPKLYKKVMFFLKNKETYFMEEK